MMFLSIMMVSKVKYPSFKTLDLRATRRFTKMVVLLLFVGFIVVLRDKILPLLLPLLLSTYLIYGFIRPYISRQMRREIEEEEEDTD
jgi:CDP-diacylglycerol---serine O-phosphatidyltransferase